MIFLQTAETIAAVKSLIETGTPVRAAVAYWGQGAVDALGITRQSDIDIVCDVLSGACNPDEVRKLLAILGPQRVRTYDRLHAKVWLTERQVILGSSNASANGLGFEGAEARSLTEANVLLDVGTILVDLDRWWNETILPTAREITQADLNRADELHLRRRVSRPVLQFTNLLTGLQTFPQSFAERNLYVWVWKHDDLDPWAEKALEEVQNQRGNEEILCWDGVENPPPAGSHVIEFDSTSNPPRFSGIFKILTDNPTVQADGGTLLLCLPVKRFEGLRLGHRRTWRLAAQEAANSGEEEWPADEFARLFLQPPGQE